MSYQEYFPFGGTSYTVGEISSAYRFTGKELDEFTGLYYFGARYYASWLGRWTTADPSGPVDGRNLFIYCSNRPINMIDPYGRKQMSGLAKTTSPKVAKKRVLFTPVNEDAQSSSEEYAAEGIFLKMPELIYLLL